MAYSTVSYTGNGSQVNFTVTFPYILQSHVKVYLDDVLTTAYSWTSSTVIQLTTAPAAGVAIDIQRDSSRGTALVDFQDAGTLTEEDLDRAILQALYVAQEAFDTSGTSAADQAAASATAAAASATAAAASATAAAASATATAASAASAASVLAASGYRGNCILKYIGTTQIRLDPYKGNSLLINGTYMTVPAAGVTLSNSGLSTDTNYYIYAYSNSGTLTLEASATAPQQSASNGMWIKNVDATRTLVGFIRTNASGQFADNPAQRFVRTWFNDQGVSGEKALASNTTFSSGTVAELSSAMRIEFLAWENEQVCINGHLTALNGDASVTQMYAQIAVSTTVGGVAGFNDAQATRYAHVTCRDTYTALASPAGYYYAQLYVADNATANSTAQAGYTGLTLSSLGTGM